MNNIFINSLLLINSFLLIIGFIINMNINLMIYWCLHFAGHALKTASCDELLYYDKENRCKIFPLHYIQQFNAVIHSHNPLSLCMTDCKITILLYPFSMLPCSTVHLSNLPPFSPYKVLTDVIKLTDPAMLYLTSAGPIISKAELVNRFVIRRDGWTWGDSP